GGLLVASPLDEDIQDVVVLVYRAPQGMAFTMHRQKDLIQVPLVARPRAPVAQLMRVLLPKLPTPLPDRFVGYHDTAVGMRAQIPAPRQRAGLERPRRVPTPDLAGLRSQAERPQHERLNGLHRLPRCDN